MWKISEVFDKRRKYVRNDLEIWEVAKTYGKWIRYTWLGLSIGETAKVCCN